MVKKILNLYNLVVFFICSLLVASGIYLLIKTLLKSSSVIGGFISFSLIVYNYLCVLSFFIIHHGWIIYVIELFIMLICGVIRHKFPITESVVFVIIQGLWFGINIIYNRFIYNTLNNVKVDIDTIKKTVVALNNAPSVVILNLSSVLCSILLISLCLKCVQKVLIYFCQQKGE